MNRAPRPPMNRSSTAGSLSDSRSRRARRGQHGDENDARGTSRESRRQRSTSTSPESPERLPFACPYAKHDPLRYSHSHQNVNTEHEYRNCSTGYWTSVARLKQHLYRTHDRSIRCCQRCWQNFSNEQEFRRHEQARSCKEKPMPEEKMDAAQHVLIKERVQGQPIQSWYSIYKILFPEDDMPASPYAEWITGKDMRDFHKMLMQRLPSLLFQAALHMDPQKTTIHPTRETRFPTTAQIVQQALHRCQGEFAGAKGLGHVFATSPTQTMQSASTSTGGDRAMSSTSRLPTHPSQHSHRHTGGISINTQFAQQGAEEDDEEDEDSSDSSIDMDMDEAMGHSTMQSADPRLSTRHNGIHHSTSANYAPNSGSYQDLVEATYIPEEFFPSYGTSNWEQ